MATLRVLLWPNSCREAATGTPLNYLWYVTSCFSSVVCLHRQCLFEWPPLLHFFKFRISNILCKTIFSTPSIHLSKAHLHLTQRPRKRNKVSPIINLRRSIKEIKSLPSLISGEACERNLLLAQMPKRRFSVFQCKNTNRRINGIFRFKNRPWING
jgi:hypothetical protein